MLHVTPVCHFETLTIVKKNNSEKKIYFSLEPPRTVNLIFNLLSMLRHCGYLAMDVNDISVTGVSQCHCVPAPTHASLVTHTLTITDLMVDAIHLDFLFYSIVHTNCTLSSCIMFCLTLQAKVRKCTGNQLN